MKRAGIVGLGTITKHYLEGLENSSLLKLCAVCDTNKNAASKDLFASFDFYENYNDMISLAKLDYIIISTPPETHFEIALFALENAVNVIIEKPAVLTLTQYDILLSLAEKNNLVFEVMYHWQNGSEVLAFNKMYDKEKISEISVCVLDPYSLDAKTINQDKVKLCGAFIDSGVNALSMIKMWLPFEKCEVLNVNTKKCQDTNLPLIADVSIKIDNIPVKIIVDWTRGIDKKKSLIIYDGREIEINHSGQFIKDGNQKYVFDEMPRLKTHYYNYFKNYNENIDTKASYLIHKILLEVNGEL